MTGMHRKPSFFLRNEHRIFKTFTIAVTVMWIVILLRVAYAIAHVLFNIL